MFAALSVKDFPGLIASFASNSRFESTLWGIIEGEDSMHYLEILMDATIEIKLPGGLQQLDQQHWQLDWIWKGIAPLNNKLISHHVPSSQIGSKTLLRTGSARC